MVLFQKHMERTREKSTTRNDEEKNVRGKKGRTNGAFFCSHLIHFSFWGWFFSLHQTKVYICSRRFNCVTFFFYCIECISWSLRVSHTQLNRKRVEQKCFKSGIANWWIACLWFCISELKKCWLDTCSQMSIERTQVYGYDYGHDRCWNAHSTHTYPHPHQHITEKRTMKKSQ